MKEMAAIGAGIVMATAVALWFMTGPVVVTPLVKPLQVDPNLSMFKPVPTPLAGEGQGSRTH